MAGLHMRNLQTSSQHAIPLQAGHQKFRASSAAKSIRDAPVRSQPLSKPRSRPLLARIRSQTAILATAEVSLRICCPWMSCVMIILSHVGIFLTPSCCVTGLFSHRKTILKSSSEGESPSCGGYLHCDPHALLASSMSGTEYLIENCCGMRRLLRSTLIPSGEPTDLFKLAGGAIPRILQNPPVHLSGMLSPHLWAGMGLWRRLEQARRWPDGSSGSGVLPAQLPNLYLREDPVPCSAFMVEDFTQEWD